MFFVVPYSLRCLRISVLFFATPCFGSYENQLNLLPPRVDSLQGLPPLEEQCANFLCLYPITLRTSSSFTLVWVAPGMHVCLFHSLFFTPPCAFISTVWIPPLFPNYSAFQFLSPPLPQMFSINLRPTDLWRPILNSTYGLSCFTFSCQRAGMLIVWFFLQRRIARPHFSTSPSLLKAPVSPFFPRKCLGCLLDSSSVGSVLSFFALFAAVLVRQPDEIPSFAFVISLTPKSLFPPCHPPPHFPWICSSPLALRASSLHSCYVDGHFPPFQLLRSFCIMFLCVWEKNVINCDFLTFSFMSTSARHWIWSCFCFVLFLPLSNKVLWSYRFAITPSFPLIAFTKGFQVDPYSISRFFFRHGTSPSFARIFASRY